MAGCGCSGGSGGSGNDPGSLFPSGTVASTTLSDRFAANANDSSFVSAGLGSFGAVNISKAVSIGVFVLGAAWFLWAAVSKRKSSG